MNFPSKSQRDELRNKFINRNMTSGIDEYCPEEFGMLLDDLDALEEEYREALRVRDAEIHRLSDKLRELQDEHGTNW